MPKKVREVVGAFPSARALEDAAQELMSRGFDRARLSLLGPRVAVDGTPGLRSARAADLEDDPRAPRIAYMDHHELALGQSAIIAALFYVAGGFTTIASLASAVEWQTAVAYGVLAGGAGGALGALVARRLGTLTAEKIEYELARGGVLLWVRTSSDEDADTAIEVFARHGARDVHGHREEPERSPLAAVG
jgi:hypothetical protein